MRGLGGKISAAHIAAQSVVPFTTLGQHQRPEPPDGMLDEEAKVWRTVVGSMSPDWFKPESFDILIQYCTSVVNCHKIAAIKHKHVAKGLNTPKQLAAYRLILRDEMQQTRQMMTLATKMRITQQSTYDKGKRKGHSMTKAWDV
jgi:hypothetical protein